MNIITKGDIKKYLSLTKIGLSQGKMKELSIYSNVTSYDGTDVIKEVYVSLELKFRVSGDIINDMLSQESIDEELKEILNGLS